MYIENKKLFALTIIQIMLASIGVGFWLGVMYAR